MSPRCRHPQRLWRHVHSDLGGPRWCRLECACGHVLDEGWSINDGGCLPEKWFDPESLPR